MSFVDMLTKVNDFVWGLPLIILILGTGILLTVRLGFIQIRRLPRALKYMVKNEEGGTGEVSSFGALCTALSATIGTGNIVGVATALVAGGPGALFWMWIAAFFGMATKYAEGLLAIKYRTIDEKGHVLGGPFYYIENGMGKKFRWLAVLFAFFGAAAGLLGIGTITQVNGITDAMQTFFDPTNAHVVSMFGNEYSIAIVISAIVVTFLVALVVIGGIKRISSVAQVIVPFMAILYIVACVFVLFVNRAAIPDAFAQIFNGAFHGTAAVGGFAGALMREAIQKGVARGIFSNEAGLGSAPIAAAAASTKYPTRQGLVSMTAVFFDTIVICTMTGLAAVTTGSWNIGLKGVNVTYNAFATSFTFAPVVGQFLVAFCLALFAFTTILGWNYYGERCVEYLSKGMKNNHGVIMVYRWLYVLAVLIGPFLTLEFVWTFADIFNGLMAFPNLIALVFLSGVVAKETKGFFNEEKLTGKIH